MSPSPLFARLSSPATTLDFLGIEIDTLQMEARLPSEKLAYLKELLAEWGHCTHVTLRDVEVLTGFLQFTSQVIPTAHAFLRGLYDFESEFTTPFSCWWLSKAACRDIAWWATFPMEWNGICFISLQHCILHVYTAVSGTKGLRGFFGANWFSVRCPHCHQTHHIQVKEMLAMVHAILCCPVISRLSGLAWNLTNVGIPVHYQVRCTSPGLT
ncbi:hypothetical protein DFH08DRAFT_812034 [Mycena albidolilacea]|uniref:Uncharacterized protein n=1 Tax=Mycena albidolilacea TaxID=1033008 RepID=A0AAD6ZV58_9AGAR|nr:hypothetical protein DFH08DRAFT_812034 [Mycena albidolilacea]